MQNTFRKRTRRRESSTYVAMYALPPDRNPKGYLDIRPFPASSSSSSSSDKPFTPTKGEKSPSPPSDDGCWTFLTHAHSHTITTPYGTQIRTSVVVVENIRKIFPQMEHPVNDFDPSLSPSHHYYRLSFSNMSKNFLKSVCVCVCN